MHPVEIGNTEAGMGVRRAQHDRVQRCGRRDIGNVTPGTAQQRIVLFARERLAEAEFHCWHLFYFLAGFGFGCARPWLARKAIQRETT
jgi:hypothetical protein